VSSLSNLALSSWTPTSDKTRLPELRHNLQLILDVAKGDVLALAKEGKAVKEKREWSIRELERLRKLQSEEDMSMFALSVTAVSLRHADKRPLFQKSRNSRPCSKSCKTSRAKSNMSIDQMKTHSRKWQKASLFC
jgi:tuftelin-interacting protein 11